uniref:ATP-dependent RNA helicase DDX54 n=1 Tax=Falco tinnunculus TaxID=100819 RepID=A0A8C4TUK2_FALTI
MCRCSRYRCAQSPCAGVLGTAAPGPVCRVPSAPGADVPCAPVLVFPVPVCRCPLCPVSLVCACIPRTNIPSLCASVPAISDWSHVPVSPVLLSLVPVCHCPQSQCAQCHRVSPVPVGQCWCPQCHRESPALVPCLPVRQCRAAVPWHRGMPITAVMSPCCPQVPPAPLPAFPAAKEDEDDGADAEPDTRAMVRAQNQKKKKSGGFQSMGLSYPVFKGIMKKGYKVPTPIQRKSIPAILRGRDVVAMARTGSGKTACFLIPMFERLKGPSQAGARALVLSPTRELALQTLKFTKELGKFTGLKTALILGGDKMEDQFAALHENPDIIIATPGRLVHVAVEMKLKLHTVEYVVFDEADRLFEMGFAEQLQEIIARLPDCHQTVLFSATLPKLLVEFARAGLTEPMLIRLDVESKLSEQLKLAFFHVRGDDKPAVLLHLLRSVVKPQDQTVVFVATKHHTEYLKELLTAQGIRCTHIYSSLDQTARKINIAKFAQGKCPVLLVTDLAARGLDIPMLDNVINYSFPAKAKLFLHRVGRVARAGRSGTAYSLVAPDEMPYVFDLHLFLGRPLVLAGTQEMPADAGGVLGRVPQSLVDDEECLLLTDHEGSLELRSLRRVADNAHKQYLRSRPGPSPESIKRAKDLDVSQLGMHPLFSARFEDTELERLKFVDSIKTYKSKATIFEINATSRTLASTVMRSKRRHDHALIEKYQRGQQEKRAAALKGQGLCPAPPRPEEGEGEGEEEDLQVTGQGWGGCCGHSSCCKAISAGYRQHRGPQAVPELVAAAVTCRAGGGDTWLPQPLRCPLPGRVLHRGGPKAKTGPRGRRQPQEKGTADGTAGRGLLHPLPAQGL